jgi:hypothetical protein
VKQIQAAKQKAMISQAMPAIAQLAAQNKPVAPPAPEPAPAPPRISPTALSMLKQKLKQGLPAEPAPVAPAPAPPAPPPAAPVNPLMLPRDITAPAKNLMSGARNVTKAQNVYNIATQKAEGVAQADSIASDSPAINEQGGLSALSNPDFVKRGSQLLSAANVMRKLKAQPEPEEAEAPVVNSPASPAIGELMAKLQGTSAPSAANTAPISAPPQPPLIAKISKKLNAKGNGNVKETPHPEEDQPYTPIPEEALTRKMLNDQQVAAHELRDYNPAIREKYSKNVIAAREGKRDAMESIANDHTPADAQVASALYHQLDHISRRAQARKAIEHYAALMTPEATKAVHMHFTPSMMEQLWKRD